MFKTNFIIVALTVILSAVWQGNLVAQHIGGNNLSASDFKMTLDSTSHYVLIDLRTPQELSDGIIPGAIHIDFFDKSFDQRIDALDKNRVYFLYCASGGRSGETMELMSSKGFNFIYNLKEGFSAWKREKLPIVAYRK